jgi:hypothetical protein
MSFKRAKVIMVIDKKPNIIANSCIYKKTRDVFGRWVEKQVLEFSTNETYVHNIVLQSRGEAATNAQNEYIFYHLYIITDEKPKVGEYALLDWEGKFKENDLRIGEVLQIDSNHVEIKNQFGNESHTNEMWPNAKWYKIIASTSDLSIYNHGDGCQAFKSLPKPSISFIEKYIHQYNDIKLDPIEDILVEYEEIKWSMRINPTLVGNEVLKVNPKDNTITIKKLKNSWNREEIETLFRNFRTDVLPFGQVIDAQLIEWFNKNL